MTSCQFLVQTKSQGGFSEGHLVYDAEQKDAPFVAGELPIRDATLVSAFRGRSGRWSAWGLVESHSNLLTCRKETSPAGQIVQIRSAVTPSTFMLSCVTRPHGTSPLPSPSRSAASSRVWQVGRLRCRCIFRLWQDARGTSMLVVATGLDA